MEAKLIVVRGKANKTSISLKLPSVIGRSREAGLTIPHRLISRQHCELFEADGLLMVRDLGSLNGTMVGARRVKESPLPPDAEFTVGPLTFRATYAYDGDLSKLPAPVWAEPEVAVSPAAAEPEVQAILVAKQEVKEAPVQEAAIGAEPATVAQPAPVAQTEAVVEPQSAAEPPASPDDMFEEFLEKLK